MSGAASLLKSRLDGLTPFLRQSLPWSPLDFIKGISPAGDRALHIAPLVRDLDAGDDLRFLCALPDGMEVALFAERLPWDSAFFGYDVAKLHGILPLTLFRSRAEYGHAVARLIELARTRGIKYLFAAVDSRDLPTLRALGAAGFALIETRCVYHRSMRSFDSRRRFRCRLATAADVDGLSAIARRGLNPYDRFHADPVIDADAAGRMMETWVRASILNGFADATFVRDCPNPSAMCALRYHRDKWPAWGTSIAQFTFGAGFPQGSSSFVKVFSEANHHLRAAGVEHCFFTTQINNRPIVRAGEHLGYRIGRGEHVLRFVF